MNKKSLKLINRYEEELKVSLKKRDNLLNTALSLENDKKNIYIIESAKIDIYCTSLSIAIVKIDLIISNHIDKNYLNNARIYCNTCIEKLEDLLKTKYMDVEFHEYKGVLDTIENFNIEKRTELVKNIGFSLDILRSLFGENSKWKWFLLDLESKLALISKNFIDLGTIYQKLDPITNRKDYNQWIKYIEIVKEILERVAIEFREKYELANKNEADFIKAISFLQILKRFKRDIGDNKGLEGLNKKLEVWEAKLQKDTKKKE